MRSIFTFVLLVCSLSALAQSIRYVSTTGTNTNPASATSWATSTTNLQGAINALTATGGQVWIAQGTYKPSGPANTDRTISFSMKNGVAVYGGFSGTETNLNQRPAITLSNPSATTLSGDLGVPGNTADNAYHVIANVESLSGTALLDGFVITGGNANGSNDFGRGGGILAVVPDASTQPYGPQFRNCLLVNNRANTGGALYHRCTPNIVNRLVLEYCVFQQNTATTGGGVFVSATGNPAFTNCAFLNNSATTGGAMSTTATAVGGTFINLINCSLRGNVATGSGGAFHNSGGNESILCFVFLINTVVWGNGPAATSFYNESAASTIRASYSLTESGTTQYIADPFSLTTTVSPFASPNTIYLNSCSRAINAGDPNSTTAAVGATDLTGNARIGDGRLDIGAVEFSGVTGRLYVREAALGNNTGQNWTDAYTDLQTALTFPCGQFPQNEIWVAGGTYRPTTTSSRAVSFTLRDGLSLYGGFIGNETMLIQRPVLNPVAGQPSSSTLTGEIGNPGSTTDNSYHVVVCPESLASSYTALIDGFVISGGYAQGLSANDNWGGGLLNLLTTGTQTIANCTFQNNYSYYSGGGLYSGSLGSMVLTNSVFRNNTSTLLGGAVSLVRQGTGNPHVLTNCLFEANSAGQTGGALFVTGVNGIFRPTLTNCQFQNNRSTDGGALHISGNPATTSLTAINSTFQSNSAVNGGAVYAATSGMFLNCSFQSNVASAGGVLNHTGTSPVFVNCVLWNNGGPNTFFPLATSSPVQLRYSLVDKAVTGYIDLVGNQIPQSSPFLSTTGTLLRSMAAAIDAGITSDYLAANGPATDLAGNPRIDNGRIDMGAYEVQGFGEVVTTKNGAWSDPSVWSLERLPLFTDRIVMRHRVNLPTDSIGNAARIRYETNGKLIYNPGSKLRLGF